MQKQHRKPHIERNPTGSKQITGQISVNSRAAGFIADEKKGDDIMIETANLNTALNRDEVEVALLPHKVRGRRTGKVVRIIKRAKTQFVGVIERKGDELHMRPDDWRFYTTIVIPRNRRETERGTDAKLKPDTKVLVRLVEWKDGKEPVGEIVTVIGKKGEHETEMRSILLEKGFESDFPKEVENEADAIKAREQEEFTNEIKNRRDFRDTLLFTIDPANAKDFDDALSFITLPNGHYEVGVHIADVSHYVREGTALNTEARERGTSVYLVDRTIPMLPHVLSNDLCSLNEKVDRLAFSAVFEMDDTGKVHSRWFGKSVIHSHKRFTYESAQELIDGSPLPLSKRETQRESNNSPSIPLLERGKGKDMAEALRTLNQIAKKLRAEKMRKGAIDFEHDEVGFELDEHFKVVRVFKKARIDTHKLIEEFMLLANREVAEFFFKNAKRQGKQLPFIYRIHDVPDRDKIETLRIFVHALGHELPMTKNGKISGKDLQALFQKIEGKAEESLIKTAAIRSMAKAIYSTANIGHFGLAFEFYTHFTSPIRRYPDLLVHRLLQEVLSGGKLNPQEFERLERMARDATQKEIAAAEAERESIKLKQVEYMQQFIGKEFEGTISGVTEWGMYIEDKNTRSEGMIKVRDLGDDYYELDAKNYSLVGQRTKKKYTLGDAVRFRVAGADLERKTLDYRLA